MRCGVYYTILAAIGVVTVYMLFVLLVARILSDKWHPDRGERR